MNSSGWADALLLCAAVIIGWPISTGRARWRTVLDARGGAGTRQSTEAVQWAGHDSKPRVDHGGTRWVGSTRWVALAGMPRRLTAAAGAVAGLAGLATAGPVAGTIAAGYLGLATHLVLRQRAARIAAGHRRDQLDEIGALAADLRAGLPMPAEAVDPPSPGHRPRGAAPDRISELVRAAVRLADRTGAPMADLLDRVEADARATDRGLAAAAAQAAGARATTWLLALLPLGGIALGFGIGVDPVDVLLHTPVGAACAITALLLQFGGLAWSDRLNATSAEAR